MSGFANRRVRPEVVRRARAGDMAAHEEIYRVFGAAVYTLCARMTGSAVTAEDLLQDTFLEVMRSLDGFREASSLATWIRRIAVSKCLMHLRSAWRRRATLFRDLGEDRAREADVANATACPANSQHDLERALARLSDASRVVVMLHDVEGYTHREIAALLGCSESYSKSRLARAHRRLRLLLDEAAVAGDERTLGKAGT